MMKSTTVHALFLCLGLYTVKSSVNVAFNKPAWLSSTWRSDPKAGNIVDGTKYIDVNTFFSRCVHTRHEHFPRWWVNLTGDYTMARIDINYRGFGTNYRMTGYKLIVSNTESTTRWNRNHQIDGHICRTETRPNPPAQQTVPCLVKGRFITYADDVTARGDPNPYVELCELEAFGCPTGWYGQGNCEERCPEGCRDRVCNPDNGTCFAGCESGLQGKTCNTTCSYGSFGLGCQQSCFCENDPCDPENGTCPGSRCQRGWNGTACDQRCGPQTFGKNCEDTCHCRQGSCDPTNGTCLYEGCEPGWQTESCSEECDHGRFGRECNLTCGACRNNDPCDHKTGTCPNNCADGWTSPFCNKTCPMGTFGFNCTSECFCKNGICDPKNGVCPGNACDRGWYGPSCSSQCEAGFFGYNCEESCYCQTESCNRTTGQCPPGGCKDGWQTNTCSQKCDGGSYGTNCSATCGNCMGNDSCHHINGHCSRGCHAGFQGEGCDKECEDYFYGINCQHSCQGCQLGKCQQVHGACMRGCISGMTGGLCDIKLVAEDHSMSIGAIGAVVGIVLLVAVVLIVAFLMHRRRTPSCERSVEFRKNDTDVYCTIVPPNEEGEKLTNMNGDIKTENDKSIYSLVNDEGLGENVYSNAQDGISVGSIASHLSQYLDDVDDNISEDIDQSENLYTNYVATADTKITVSELAEIIAFKKESSAFHEEYAKLPRGLQHAHECGKGPEKKDKNRFKDMFPYDHSRVALTTLPDVKNSDYINANYIDSVCQERQYIATQGPKEGTVWDFWRMIWEQNSGKIIMVTNVKEGKKVKCHPYWPSVGGTMTNGQLSVTVTKEKRFLAFISRTLRIMDQETEEKRTVFHFHFITWPDHGVPNPFQLVQFQRSVDKQQTSLPGPLVVHCSAGIGRTGTYIGLDALLKHAQTSPTIDVYQYTLTMRKNRLNMIQTVEQYIALHDALDVSLTFPDTSIPKGQFGESDVRPLRIQDEFEALCKIKRAFVEKEYSTALSNANISKNRSKDCIPANRFRVRLKAPLDGRTDYINAVVLPSCSSPCGFLATQLPLVDTVVDFWTMVYDYNTKIVVLLDRQESNVQLLPRDDQSDLEIEGFKVGISSSDQASGDAEEIDICLQKQDKEKRPVKVLLAPVSADDTNRIVTHRLVNAVSSVIRLEMTQKSAPITVVCRDGRTNCVPFCLLKAVIGRIDIDSTIDVFNAAREIQNRRPDTFKTMDDIRVVYQALEEYIHTTSIYANE